MLLWYAGLMLVILIVVLCALVEIKLQVVYRQHEDHIKIKLNSGGVISLEYRYPAQGRDFNLTRLLTREILSRDYSFSPSTLQSVKDCRSLLKQIRISELQWHTIIGTGDAMYTGLSIGCIWTLKGTLITLLGRAGQTARIRVEVQPDFEGQHISSELTCIFKLRIAHIILIVIRMTAYKIGRYLDGYTATGKPRSSH